MMDLQFSLCPAGVSHFITPLNIEGYHSSLHPITTEKGRVERLYPPKASGGCTPQVEICVRLQKERHASQRAFLFVWSIHYRCQENMGPHTVGGTFAPYKCFCKRRNPWRRGGFAAPEHWNRPVAPKRKAPAFASAFLLYHPNAMDVTRRWDSIN